MSRRNSSGGKSYKRHRKWQPTERVVPTKTEGQDYGYIDRALGDGRFLVLPVGATTQPVVARVRGSMRRKRWVRPGDCVLFGDRDCSDTMKDILHVYKPDDLAVLRALRHLPLKDEEQPLVLAAETAADQQDDDDDVEVDAI